MWRTRDEHGRMLCPACAVSTHPVLTSRQEQEWGRHLIEGHGWTEDDVARAHPADLGHIHTELHDPRNSDTLAPARHRHAALRRTAHESEDDSLIMHCPWDGSGQVIGSSDGSISCGFCARTFTVRLQPAYPAAPITDPATGEPLESNDPSLSAPAPPLPDAPPPAPAAPPVGLGDSGEDAPMDPEDDSAPPYLSRLDYVRQLAVARR